MAKTVITSASCTIKEVSKNDVTKFNTEHNISVNLSNYTKYYGLEYSGQFAYKEDMPAGMLKVLEILNNSLEVVNEKGELFVSANEIKAGDNIYVSYKGADGLYNTEKGKISITPALNAKNIVQQGNGWVYTFEKEGIGGRLGSRYASICGVNVEIPPFVYLNSNPQRAGTVLGG